MVRLFAKGVHLAEQKKRGMDGFFRKYWKARLNAVFRKLLFQKAHHFSRASWPDRVVPDEIAEEYDAFYAIMD